MRLSPYPHNYNAAFAFSGFPCPQSQQLSLRSACPEGRDFGFSVFRISDNGRLGAGCSPTDVVSTLWETASPETIRCTFWFVPVSIFGTVEVTRIITDSHMFTILPSLGPCRVMLAASSCPHGFDFTLAGSGYIVGMAPHMAVASHARIPRLLPVERQVLP